MRLLILGGSGATGKLLIDAARKAGHDVTAPPRGECDVTRQGDLERALEGREAVVALLSARDKNDPVRSKASAALIAAMRAKGIKRVVWISSSGAGDSLIGATKTSFVFGKIIVPLVFKRQFADAAVAEEALRGSGLEFTVFRPMQLVDGERAGEATAVDPTVKAPSAKISRTQVARFVLRELEAPAHIGKMPVLCG